MSEGILIVKSSNYNKIYVNVNGELQSVSVDTRDYKVFHGDIVGVTKGSIDRICSTSSPYRYALLPGILDITSIKRYGFSKRGTPIYMWRPFHANMPAFYVASNIRKSMREPYNNVYCIIRYDNWIRDRPSGTQIRILGDVWDDKATVKYLQYCYGLYQKIYKFPKTYEIPDIDEFIGSRETCDDIIFSVDPEGTLDVDDAFSIRRVDDVWDIGIYIADPAEIIDAMEMGGCEGLLDSICSRGLTLYSKWGNDNMMPSNISTGLASLLPHKSRSSISVHLRFNGGGRLLPDVKIRNDVVVNTRAYSYEEVDKIVERGKTGKGVYKLYELSQKIARVELPRLYADEWDSHKMVETMMVIANVEIAKFLQDNVPRERLITRKHDGINAKIAEIPEDLRSRIRGIGMKSAEYTLENGRHYGLGVELYTHYTSPMRRIVDLYTHYLIREACFGKSMPERMQRLPGEVARINELVKNGRRYHQTLDKIDIFHHLREIDSGELVDGYIVGMSENSMRIYITQYNIVLRHYLVHPEMRKIYIFSLYYDGSKNIYKQRVECEDGSVEPQEYTLYKGYKIRLYAVLADRIRDRIRFEFQD